MRKVLGGFDFIPPSQNFDQNDFAAMADALGISSLDDEDRAVLQRECDRFMALIPSWGKAGRPSEVRKILKKVHADVVRLMKNIHLLHDGNAPNQPMRQSAMALLHSAAPGNDWAVFDTDLMAFAERLAGLGKAAKDAISELSDGQAGPPGDQPLSVLANGLADLFTEITNKSRSITSDQYAEPENEFGGRFIDFVEAFLRPLAPHYQRTRRDLGSSLKRILRARKHAGQGT